MLSAALRRARGQATAIAGAGAPASASASPTHVSIAAPPTAPSLFFRLKPRPQTLDFNQLRRAGGMAANVTDVTEAVTGAVTAKSLFRHGLRGSYSCYRISGDIDACAGARARALISLSFSSNISNIDDYAYCSIGCELPGPLLRGWAGGNAGNIALGLVPSIGRALASGNKIGGVYSGAALASADLQSQRGEAGRNFPASGRAAWPIGAAELLELGAGRNGGNPPFLAASAAPVGTGLLEWVGQAILIERENAARRKLRRLPQGAADADQAEAGGTPPIAARSLRCMLAQPFLRIWIALRDGCPAADPERAQTSIRQTGSGVSIPARVSLAQGAKRGLSEMAKRVGDGLCSALVGQADRPWLWGAPGHVNA